MVCCLMVPSLYLNQCWLVISLMGFCGTHLTSISKEVLKIWIRKMCLKIRLLNLLGARELIQSVVNGATWLMYLYFIASGKRPFYIDNDTAEMYILMWENVMSTTANSERCWDGCCQIALGPSGSHMEVMASLVGHGIVYPAYSVYGGMNISYEVHIMFCWGYIVNLCASM